MGDLSSGKIDVEKLISYSDDLVAVLKENRDVSILEHCLHVSNSLKSSTDADFNDVTNLLQEYEKKIEECRQKTNKAKSEAPTDAEIERLHKELEAELEKERLYEEELRVINSEIDELDRQRISIEEQKRAVKKLEQDEQRAMRKLSMYASVTKIIPNLVDHSKIAGHIVDRDKKAVEKFEFDPAKMSSFDTCQSIWKMITP